MSSLRQSTVGVRGLGAELRELRKARQLSGRKVAGQLGWQVSKISRIENGKQGIKVEDVASLLVVYGVTGEERSRLLSTAERANNPGWWETNGGLSDESRTLIQLEATATQIIEVQPLVIPGLLQTPDYTRAVMKSCDVPEPEVEVRVVARMGRQAILSRDEPPTLHAIVDEMALRRALGSSRTMARQLRRLTEAAEEPNVTLRVLPFTLGGHPGLDGPFIVMDFARAKPVVYLDHKLSGLFLEEPAHVAFFRQQADTLTEMAMSLAESIDFVARLAREHDRE
ncbi:helix-turn-helix transcriptional regulator [Actinomadura vinacea]|uniref:Helix-turn-helix transcriptional regulator n=2 Tax=Actinomadura vinacea TaxID=115336 RepID=A0ABN3J852_9ACTN